MKEPVFLNEPTFLEIFINNRSPADRDLVFKIPIEGRCSVNKTKVNNDNEVLVDAGKLAQLFRSEFEAYTPAFLPLQPELVAGYIRLLIDWLENSCLKIID